MTDKQLRPNLSKMTNGVYVIRSQAGYRKLLKRLKAFNPDAEIERPIPPHYPVVVRTCKYYTGVDRVQIVFSKLSEEIEFAKTYLAKLQAQA